MQTKTANHHRVDEFANALVALANAVDALTTIEDDLMHLIDFLKESESLRRFLDTETITREGKRRAIHDLLNGRIHPLLVDFLILLLSANAINLLDAIAQRFFDKATDIHEHLSGELHVATPLDDQRLADITTAVSHLLQKRVTLRQRVEPDILGGARVTVNDTIIDGTLDRQLDDARQQLLA